MSETNPYPSSLCLFGGSFDPIHIGHLILGQHVINELNIQKILFMPAYNPPHKPLSNGATPQQRYDMVDAAITGNDSFLIGDYELTRKRISYTIDTVDYLVNNCSVTDLHLLIGEDSLQDFITWKNYDKIIGYCTLVVFRRFFMPVKNTAVNEEKIKRLKNPIIEISSTSIRDFRQGGKSIHYLVPPSVEEYIKCNELYLP